MKCPISPSWFILEKGFLCVVSRRLPSVSDNCVLLVVAVLLIRVVPLCVD
jgi:hypothetical protein